MDRDELTQKACVHRWCIPVEQDVDGAWKLPDDVYTLQEDPDAPLRNVREIIPPDAVFCVYCGMAGARSEVQE